MTSAETVSAAKTPAPVAAEEDSGPDVLELALLTIGAAAAAALLALIGYAVRRRIGFWLHRPPPGGGGHH